MAKSDILCQMGDICSVYGQVCYLVKKFVVTIAQSMVTCAVVTTLSHGQVCYHVKIVVTIAQPCVLSFVKCGLITQLIAELDIWCTMGDHYSVHGP